MSEEASGGLLDRFRHPLEPAAGFPNVSIPSLLHAPDSSERNLAIGGLHSGTVRLEIEAGRTAGNSYLNFNGHAHGEATITIPAGVAVHLDFTNADPAGAHSIGIDGRTGKLPLVIENPQPVFSGAISSNPTSFQGGTRSRGRSETLNSRAETPGHYSLICYMPGHAAPGQCIRLHVLRGK